MNIYSIMESACEALVADTTLQANAQSWYGHDLAVYIDQDKGNPPGDSLAPSIQLHSWSFDAAERDRNVSGGFEALVTVADSAIASRPDDVVEFSGTSRLDSIIRRAIIVMQSAKPAGTTMRCQYETDTINYFPVMLAGMKIEYAEVLAARQDPFS